MNTSMIGAHRVIGAVMLIALLSSCKRAGSIDARNADSGAAFKALAVGDSVPTYLIRTIAGDSLRLGANERPTLLNVWATWCESCREEMKVFGLLDREYGSRGLRVVAVSVDGGDDARINRFAAHQQLRFAVAHDAEARIQQQLNVVGVPSSYLIGHDGRVLWQYTGNVGDVEPELRAAIMRAVPAPEAR